MSVELLSVVLIVTLLSLVLTGLPFFNHVVKTTGKGVESRKHSSDWLVPAMREESILSTDTLRLGTRREMSNIARHEHTKILLHLQLNRVLKLKVAVVVFPIQLLAVKV